MAPLRSDVGQFGIVPVWLLKRGISSHAVHLYAVLVAIYADREGKAWPARDTLAEQMAVSSDTVDRAIKELLAVGALAKQRRWKDGGGSASSIYYIRVSRPGEGLEEADHTPQKQEHGPHGCGLHGPHGCGTNHTQLEPDLKEPVTPAKSAGVSPAADKRLIPKDVLVEFTAQWEARYAPAKLAGITDQHAKMAKSLGSLTLLDLKRRISLYLGSTNGYYEERGHDFLTFVKDVNRFVDVGPRTAPAASTRQTDEEKATAQRVADAFERRRLQRRGGEATKS